MKFPVFCFVKLQETIRKTTWIFFNLLANYEKQVKTVNDVDKYLELLQVVIFLTL